MSPTPKQFKRPEQKPLPKPNVDLIASIAAQYIWRILYRQPIQSFASFVDGDTLSVRSLPICRDELLPYLERS